MGKPLPLTALNCRQNIRFLHPGYSVYNTLLSLPRVDCRTGTGATFGVHRRTALLACQVIAGNAFDTGYLALDREGVVLPLDDILIDEVYYFLIDGGPGVYSVLFYPPYPLVDACFCLDLYSIVPSFRDWEFPHDHIPDFWPQVPTTHMSYRCGISNFSYAIEGAHLVPQEEAHWFGWNQMRRYGHDVLSNIDDPANILFLRADLRRCFDKGWFAIIPKTTETVTQYTTHILLKAGAELWPAYHNTIVEYLHEQARPFLFARFAWAIFMQVKPFIVEGIPRHVIRIQTSGEGIVQRKEELLSGAQLKTYYGDG